MPRIVKCGLIQATHACSTAEKLDTIREANIAKHMPLIEQAGREGVQILCMQEIFTGPYFCAEQTTRWYDAVEAIPDGPTTKLMQEVAKKHEMVIVVPLYEEDGAGRLLQHRRRHRRRRHLPRQVPQEPHPALRAGLLGEVLLPARQPRLSGVQDPVRRRRRLHLLRPPLPRGRARARPERRRDRVQPVGHRGRPVRVPLEARAAGARRGQRLLRRRDQPRRLRGAVAHRRVLRPELLLRPARADRSPRPSATTTSW